MMMIPSCRLWGTEAESIACSQIAGLSAVDNIRTEISKLGAVDVAWPSAPPMEQVVGRFNTILGFLSECPQALAGGVRASIWSELEELYKPAVERAFRGWKEIIAPLYRRS